MRTVLHVCIDFTDTSFYINCLYSSRIGTLVALATYVSIDLHRYMVVGWGGGGGRGRVVNLVN